MQFDKNSDLSTTYLGKADRSKNKEIKAEESFPISKQGYTMEKLLDRTECQILLDTAASKSFMSKSHHLCCKSFHTLQKFASKTQRIQVGNGQFVKCFIHNSHKLQYMDNTIFMKDKRVWDKPLRNRIEAIQKMHPPTTVKGCRSFPGMVNFLSMFFPELQKLLKPIYDLTRMGRQCVWGKEQEDAFEEIKHRLVKPPV